MQDHWFERLRRTDGVEQERNGAFLRRCCKIMKDGRRTGGAVIKTGNLTRPGTGIIPTYVRVLAPIDRGWLRERRHKSAKSAREVVMRTLVRSFFSHLSCARQPTFRHPQCSMPDKLHSIRGLPSAHKRPAREAHLFRSPTVDDFYSAIARRRDSSGKRAPSLGRAPRPASDH